MRTRNLTMRTISARDQVREGSHCLTDINAVHHGEIDRGHLHQVAAAWGLNTTFSTIAG